MNDANSATEQSSPSRVVSAIMRGIRAGRFAPGQRLIEVDLTRELHVSRGPVREAFKRLAGEGVLALARFRGAYVRRMSRSEVNDTLVVMETLTGLSASLAAQQVSRDRRRGHRVTAAYDALMNVSENSDHSAARDARGRFYEALIDAAGNHELRRIMPQAQIVLLRAQFQGFLTMGEQRRHLEEYRAIHDAVLAGDAEKAARATRMHLRRRRENIMALPEDAFATDGTMVENTG